MLCWENKNNAALVPKKNPKKQKMKTKKQKTKTINIFKSI